MHLEFHGGQLIEDAAHAVLDHSPGDLVFTLCGRLDSVPRHIEESNHVAQHSHGLVERAVPIIRRITENSIYFKLDGVKVIVQRTNL